MKDTTLESVTMKIKGKLDMDAFDFNGMDFNVIPEANHQLVTINVKFRPMARWEKVKRGVRELFSRGS